MLWEFAKVALGAYSGVMAVAFATVTYREMRHHYSLPKHERPKYFTGLKHDASRKLKY